MKTTKTKSFDAVAESRLWKESVARETADLTREEVLAFFSKDQALAALGQKVHREESTSIIREEPRRK